MRPAASILEGKVGRAPSEGTAQEAYDLARTLLLDRSEATLRELASPRTSVRKYVRLRARREGLLEAVAIVEALLKRHLPSQPAPPERPVRARPSGTYGSGPSS